MVRTMSVKQTRRIDDAPGDLSKRVVAEPDIGSLANQTLCKFGAMSGKKRMPGMRLQTPRRATIALKWGAAYIDLH